MFWTAVASSTLSSNSAESSAGLASAAPSYQQQHTKPSPLRASSSSWQLSNAAFKSRLQQQQLLQQHQQQIQQQDEQQQQQSEDFAQQEVQPNKEEKPTVGQKTKPQTANIKKKISPRSESKIFKAFTSCKCTQK
ncbi:GATA zinc finger domain-containing protein 10 [Drosophila eugracilis]|uniref:GATA zinc finger domain-containing protein 10 n=1 Tax=Drosophila eugracilis TaxID=29029 RepID=UPI0007E6331A|nr:GATA zinc finger domain-containing protein 10 [Drosophila eugracilis]